MLVIVVVQPTRALELIKYQQTISKAVTKFKVAPYSLAMARALRTNTQVMCARSKENVIVFRYFITSTRTQNAKLTVNFRSFPSVKFRKIWQTVSKYLTLVGVFQGNLYDQYVFWQHKFETLEENCLTKPYFFRV